MSADPKNIIAIHCKGGKGDIKHLFWYPSVSGHLYQMLIQLLSFTGRTGTMVCTWLIDNDQFESAQVHVQFVICLGHS